MRTQNYFILAALAAMLAMSTTSSAATITAVNGGETDGWALLEDSGEFSVSDADLLQTDLSSSAIMAGGASFTSTLEALYNGIVYDPSEASLFAATGGVNGFAPGNCGPESLGYPGYYQFTPTTIELVLDTSVNTLGYEIESLVMLSGYIENRNTVQAYDVNVWKVGGSAWEPLYSVDSTLTNNDSSKAEVQVTATGFGEAAKGVEKIQLVFSEGSDYLDASQYRELDVFGTPSLVPEPSLLTLLGAGLMGLLLYSGRKRR